MICGLALGVTGGRGCVGKIRRCRCQCPGEISLVLSADPICDVSIDALPVNCFLINIQKQTAEVSFSVSCSHTTTLPSPTEISSLATISPERRAPSPKPSSCPPQAPAWPSPVTSRVP